MSYVILESHAFIMFFHGWNLAFIKLEAFIKLYE